MSTISAIVTPQTAAGIGIVRRSGEDAIKIADKVFKGVSGKKIEEKNDTALKINQEFQEYKKTNDYYLRGDAIYSILAEK